MDTMTNDLHELIKKVLYPTQIIKNCKEFCKILNQEPKTNTNSKKAFEKEISRYLLFEKDKQKYIIIEIYNEPLPKDDKRSLGNNSIYVQHIEILLLNYLSKQQGFKTTLTLKNLFLLMGMINNEYIKEDKEKLKLSSENITDFQINHFYQRTYQKLRKIIFDTLRNLKNRCLIDYEELTVINIKEVSTISNMMNTITRIATDEEKKNITNVKKIVLNEMGLDSITLVHLKFKHVDFYNRVNILLKQKYNINYVYTDIKILFTHKHIIEALEIAELNMQKYMLNDKVITAVNEQARYNLDKSIDNYNEQIEEFLKGIIGVANSLVLSKFFKLSDTYLDAQFELAELLLRL